MNILENTAALFLFPVYLSSPQLNLMVKVMYFCRTFITAVIAVQCTYYTSIVKTWTVNAQLIKVEPAYVHLVVSRITLAYLVILDNETFAYVHLVVSRITLDYLVIPDKEKVGFVHVVV